jgi:hypothetical protein
MPTTLPDNVPLTALTESTVEGNGVFDLLMKAATVHLEQEYAKNRIRGPEYATVYLGGLQAVLSTAVDFLLQQRKNAYEVRLLEQQVLNAELEGAVLVAQECKLRAEYDLTMKGVEKATAEIALLVQKLATEKAQTIGSGVDVDSVIGKQKGLYQAQTDGFKRDAEQKAAKLLVDSWNVRRTTDETGTSANTTNHLDDATIGRAVNKLLDGVGA